MKEGEVADKNRGGRSVDDGDDTFEGDDAFDDALDTEDEFDESLAEDADEAPAKPRAKAESARARTVARTRTRQNQSRGLLGKVVDFVREVVAELQKVIWPTRKELLTYTTVVVIFVSIMMTFVALLDVGFARLMLLVFGGDTTT